jgi:hypothetical protein
MLMVVDDLGTGRRMKADPVRHTSIRNGLTMP